MGPEANRWFRQAFADHKAATDNVRLGNFYLVAQLCQQAVEKALKGFFIHKKGRMPPRTHSLRILAGRLGVPSQFSGILSALEPAYMLTRYPDVAQGVPAEL